MRNVVDKTYIKPVYPTEKRDKEHLAATRCSSLHCSYNVKTKNMAQRAIFSKLLCYSYGGKINSSLLLQGVKGVSK